ncbi:MAG: hypothetical protein ACXWIT_27155 [Burkholderiales bacterium]
MKSFARTLLVMSFLSTAAGAIAAESPYPSSAPETYSQTDVFPNLQTYEQAHHASAMTQAPMPGPVPGRSDSYNATSVFPNMQTYADQHRNEPVQASNTPTFPSSAPETTSMTEEGLVPGVAGAPAYANHSDGAVGTTH